MVTVDMARDLMARPLFVSLALVLYLTVPIQIGFQDGHSALQGSPSSGRLEMNGSLLMQGCGPALVAGMAAVVLAAGGVRRGPPRPSAGAFRWLSVGIYLVYLPAGFTLCALSRRMAAGSFTAHPVDDFAIFAVSSLAPVVWMLAGLGVPRPEPAEPRQVALRVGLSFIPLGLFDLLHAMLGSSGFQAVSPCTQILSMALGLAVLAVTGTRR